MPVYSSTSTGLVAMNKVGSPLTRNSGYTFLLNLDTNLLRGAVRLDPLCQEVQRQLSCSLRSMHGSFLGLTRGVNASHPLDCGRSPICHVRQKDNANCMKCHTFRTFLLSLSLSRSFFFNSRSLQFEHNVILDVKIIRRSPLFEQI